MRPFQLYRSLIAVVVVAGGLPACTTGDFPPTQLTSPPTSDAAPSSSPASGSTNLRVLPSGSGGREGVDGTVTLDSSGAPLT